MISPRSKASIVWSCLQGHRGRILGKQQLRFDAVSAACRVPQALNRKEYLQSLTKDFKADLEEWGLTVVLPKDVVFGPLWEEVSAAIEAAAGAA